MIILTNCEKLSFPTFVVNCLPNEELFIRSLRNFYLNNYPKLDQRERLLNMHISQFPLRHRDRGKVKKQIVYIHILGPTDWESFHVLVSQA